MKDHKLFLAAVHKHPRFKDWMEDVEKEQPTIPLFDPRDENHDRDVWAYWSGMREGYKLALSHLGVILDE